MKEKEINDLDHYAILTHIKKNELKSLAEFQEILIEKFGDEECFLISQFYSGWKKEEEVRKESLIGTKKIKFPFEVLK